MKISINDVEVFTLTQTQKKIMKNDINDDVFDNIVKNCLIWVLIDEKVKRGMVRLRKEWVEGGKLAANGVTSIPIDDMLLADLIFSQDNTKPFPYKSRKARDNEAAAQGGA